MTAQANIGVGQLSYLASFDYFNGTSTVTATYGTTYVTESVRIDMNPVDEGDITLHDGEKMSWTAKSHSATVRARIILSTTSKAIYIGLTSSTTQLEALDYDFLAYIKDGSGNTLVTIQEVSGSRVQVYSDGELSFEGGAFSFEVVIKADEVTLS